MLKNGVCYFMEDRHILIDTGEKEGRRSKLVQRESEGKPEEQILLACWRSFKWTIVLLNPLAVVSSARFQPGKSSRHVTLK